MYLHELVASIKPDTRIKAEKLLKSENFTSLKDFGDGYESMITTEYGILLPQVVLTDDYAVSEYECQCRKGKRNDFCIHVAAMLLGIETMLQADCDDYHTAVKKLE